MHDYISASASADGSEACLAELTTAKASNRAVVNQLGVLCCHAFVIFCMPTAPVVFCLIELADLPPGLHCKGRKEYNAEDIWNLNSDRVG